MTILRRGRISSFIMRRKNICGRSTRHMSHARLMLTIKGKSLLWHWTLYFRRLITNSPETEWNLMINLAMFCCSFQLTPLETDILPSHLWYQPTNSVFTSLFVRNYKAAKIPSLIKNPGNKKMAGTGDIMFQLFSCCMQQQPSPTRRRHQRLRIDRTMIGNPTNFVHTGKSMMIDRVNIKDITNLIY